MIYFKNDRFGDMICMETTVLSDMRIQTVMDSGFLLYPKKRDPIPHRHLNYELYFFKRGSCQTVCEGELFFCAQGEVLVIPRGAEHSVLSLSENACIYSLRFSVFPHAVPKGNPHLYETFVDCLKMPVKSEARDALSVPLCQLRKELAKKSVLCGETISALLTLFYANLFRTLVEADAPPEAEEFSVILDPKAVGNLQGYRKDTPQEFYIDVLDDFFTHLPPDPPTLEMLCDHLHLSLRQTRRLIRTHYGMSFRQKLSKTRIDTAKRLIQTTELSLEEISHKAGYTSYNAFFEAFTAQTGMNPSQYRQHKTSTLPRSSV